MVLGECFVLEAGSDLYGSPSLLAGSALYGRLAVTRGCWLACAVCLPADSTQVADNMTAPVDDLPPFSESMGRGVLDPQAADARMRLFEELPAAGFGCARAQPTKCPCKRLKMMTAVGF